MQVDHLSHSLVGAAQAKERSGQLKTLSPRSGCRRWLGRGGAVVKNCE